MEGGSILTALTCGRMRAKECRGSSRRAQCTPVVQSPTLGGRNAEGCRRRQRDAIAGECMVKQVVAGWRRHDRRYRSKQGGSG